MIYKRMSMAAQLFWRIVLNWRMMFETMKLWLFCCIDNMENEVLQLFDICLNHRN